MNPTLGPVAGDSPATGARVLLDVQQLSKTFPGVRALTDVCMTVATGEVVALVGHNGSGKSTLVKILAGIHRPDPGAQIALDGGLHVIHQDLGLVSTLSTVENLDLGRRMGWRALRRTRRAERAAARTSVAGLGGTFDVSAPVGDLTPAERTIVAIARATSRWTDDRNVLVLDEPTASLHGEEAERLKDVVRRAAARGVGVIYISHRLDEVVELADRAVVLRDGHQVAALSRGQFDHDRLVELISGTTVDQLQTQSRQSHTEHAATEQVPRLQIHNLTSPRLRGIDITVHSGEIVGLCGLLGSGMEEVLSTTFGARTRTGGRVTVNGDVVPATPAGAIAAGIAHAPADRRAHGAVLGLNARENLTLVDLRGLRTRTRRLDLRRERTHARQTLDQVAVRPAQPERSFALFSGGNQQKIVIAKWLRITPSVVLFDEPTQGVDVGAQAGIYALVHRAARGGAAVLVASSDTKELASLCNRVLVLNDGVITGEYTGVALTETALIRAASSGSITGATAETPQHPQPSPAPSTGDPT